VRPNQDRRTVTRDQLAAALVSVLGWPSRSAPTPKYPTGYIDQVPLGLVTGDPDNPEWVAVTDKVWAALSPEEPADDMDAMWANYAAMENDIRELSGAPPAEMARRVLERWKARAALREEPGSRDDLARILNLHESQSLSIQDAVDNPASHHPQCGHVAWLYEHLGYAVSKP
jgi:hypothetical protein